MLGSRSEHFNVSVNYIVLHIAGICLKLSVPFGCTAESDLIVSLIAMKICLTLALVLLFSCAAVPDVPQQRLLAGKAIAFERAKGNCLACHVIEDGESPGNIGPELTKLSTHFKNKQQLRDQIWDASRFNPETSMPPFGKNKILSEEEIDKIADYLWSLD